MCCVVDINGDPWQQLLASSQYLNETCGLSAPFWLSIHSEKLGCSSCAGANVSVSSCQFLEAVPIFVECFLEPGACFFLICKRMELLWFAIWEVISEALLHSAEAKTSSNTGFRVGKQALRTPRLSSRVARSTSNL